MKFFYWTILLRDLPCSTWWPEITLFIFIWVLSPWIIHTFMNGWASHDSLFIKPIILLNYCTSCIFVSLHFIHFAFFHNSPNTFFPIKFIYDFPQFSLLVWWNWYMFINCWYLNRCCPMVLRKWPSFGSLWILKFNLSCNLFITSMITIQENNHIKESDNWN